MSSNQPTDNPAGAPDTTGAQRTQAAEQNPGTGPITAGPGRMFTFLYGVFAVGASSRAVFQLATKASEAPVAYTLSALSALVYVAAFVLLLRWGHRGSRAALRVVCIVELIGVVTVGTLTVLVPDLFPDTTVWSYYGVGYLLLPAILPVLVLRWLAKTDPRQHPNTEN